MKILLDECVDQRLARDIVGHEVITVQQMGWKSKQNGELLSLAAREFEAFVTIATYRFSRIFNVSTSRSL